MSRPDAYRLADGTRVPSVTDILGSVHHGDGLIGWAANLARQGRSWREERDGAGRVGHELHALVEWHLRGCEWDTHPGVDAPVSDEAHRAYTAWLGWYAAHAVDPISIERPLVSERMRYGGTPDLIAHVDGRLCVVDWKTSSRIRPEYVAQLAAYAALWTEHTGAVVERGIVVRCPKDGGAAEVLELDGPALAAGMSYFASLRLALDAHRFIEEVANVAR